MPSDTPASKRFPAGGRKRQKIFNILGYMIYVQQPTKLRDRRTTRHSFVGRTALSSSWRKNSPGGGLPFVFLTAAAAVIPRITV